MAPVNNNYFEYPRIIRARARAQKWACLRTAILGSPGTRAPEIAIADMATPAPVPAQKKKVRRMHVTACGRF